ncbi:MAG: IscS subfamily cysteine desulfurase [Pseudomonadota bacterium]
MAAKVTYLDYAATTPVDPRVAERMSDCLQVNGNFGNPASRSHAFGWQAEEAVETARVQVAQVLGADPREIVWTSGATESDNLAIKGLAERAEGGHIITSAIEHKAVLDTCAWLESRGYGVTYLTPGTDGRVTPDAVAAALRPDTLLVSLMHVNNELGCINDIAAIGARCREAGIPFHTDAAQSFGKVPIDVRQVPVDLISISGHKIYGPKGIGALYVRREPALGLRAQIHGGGHERGMRSGTLPTHQIVGLGAAAELMAEQMPAEHERLRQFGDTLRRRLLQLPDTHLHGSETERVPGIMNIGFGGVDGETLLLALDDLALSTGSACTSATVEPSYVLRALGVADEVAHASLRFSVGRFTTAAEVEHAGDRVVEVVERLRRG